MIFDADLSHVRVIVKRYCCCSSSST